MPDLVGSLIQREALGQDERGVWGQELNPIFSHGTLLIPREGRPEEDPTTTFSPAAAVRQSTQRQQHDAAPATKGRARDPEVDWHWRHSRATPGVAADLCTRGVFASLDSLGATVAFFERAKRERPSMMPATRWRTSTNSFPTSPCPFRAA